MSKYLSLFEQNSEYRESSKTLPNVSNVIEDEAVYYQDDYSGEYLTFKILSDGEIGWKSNHANTTLKTIQYSINNGEWTSITSSTEGATFNVQIGDVVRFKGDNAQYGTNNVYYNSFTSTCKFSIEGNIMSLLGDNFSSMTSFTGNEVFTGLFYSCVNLIDAKRLLLPVIIINKICYRRLFSGCINLISAPNLPAITMYNSCYGNMFENCKSLTIAPELPATTLESYCYANMFAGCTSLTEAPVLPATKLQLYSYQQMFQGCSSLNHITCLATNISARDCTKNWVSGVAATGTFVKAVGMEDWTTGNNGIPEGWTAEEPIEKLDYYSLKSNEYIDLGVINSTGETYKENSTATSYVYGYVTIKADSTSVDADFIGGTLFTNNNHEFSIGSNSEPLKVDGVANWNWTRTSSSGDGLKYYMVGETTGTPKSYNNAIWAFASSLSFKIYFETHGQQPWDFVNSPVAIGSKTGNSTSLKIASVEITIPVDSTSVKKIIYPYLDTITNKVIFMSDDRLVIYNIITV